MITPSPQVNKSFDPPLAARPMPIRTGSLSPTPSPARRRARAVGLRQATSMLGMRSLQGISHLRSLTLPQKARERSESNSGSSLGSRKGTRERPLVIGWPILDGGSPKSGLDRRTGADRSGDGRPTISRPVMRRRASALCAPVSDTNEFDKFQTPMLTPTAEVESPQEYTEINEPKNESTRDTSGGSTDVYGDDDHSAKRIGGVELWGMKLSIDHDALRDALEDHPNPLNSNPTSEHDGEEPATPWTTLSSNAGDAEAAEPIAAYWQPTPSPSPSPRRRPRSITLAAASACGSAEPTSLTSTPLSKRNRSLSKQPCACDTVPRLRSQLANLRAGNSALLALKAAHEETITILRDNIHSQETTISRQENTIADLAWQVQAKETEQMSIIENFCAEIASQNREITQLGEDKWYLMGRVEELELKVANIEGPVEDDRQGPVEPQEAATDGSTSIAAEGVIAGNLRDVRNVKSPSLAETSHSNPSPPVSDPGASINNDNTETPNTMISSLFSPTPRSCASNQSLYALTPTPSLCKAPGIRISTHDKGQCGLSKSPRRGSKHARRINALGTRDSPNVSEQHSWQSRDSQTITAQVVLAAKAMLEQKLAGAQEKLATSESHALELQAQLACQATLIQQLTRTSAVPTSTSFAHTPISDLPVLTYTTSGAVWLDRVTSSFKYLGLLDFIQRDVPQPEISTWDATEVTDWTSRRLRAVVLLKQAVDDDILEDVLYLQGRNEKTPGCRDLFQSASVTDDPHQLLVTITSLRRIVATAATDLSWLDRIESTDFKGIESFTSLVLCVDKRHGVMYGTSVDHYDVLLPKLQETMARLFPELKGSMFAEASDSGLPRKWRQLPIWMAKVVKRRQISGDS